MDGSVVAELLKAGPLGATIVALAWIAYRVWLDNKATQAQRVDDAKDYQTKVDALQALRVQDSQAVTGQLLKVNEQFVVAVSHVTAAMDANKEAMTELRQTLREFGEELRRSRK